MLHADLPRWPSRLTPLQLTLTPGTLLAVLGPNGAGKSSLLQVLAGEIAPLRPHVHLDGHPLDRWSPADLADRRALLEQHPPVVPALTVTETLRLAFRRPLPRWRRHPVIEALELGALFRRPMASLSGGERQRVHLARVCLQLISGATGAFQYLLLDESLQSLDIRHQQRFLAFLARWRCETPLSIIWVSHDLTLARQHADRVLLLGRGGSMIAEGPTSSVMTDAHLTRLYDWPLRVHHCDGADVVVSGGSSVRDQRARAEKSSGLR